MTPTIRKVQLLSLALLVALGCASTSKVTETEQTTQAAEAPKPTEEVRIQPAAAPSLDPIYFEESIKVTIEHGHANHRSDDYSSTAYWYQTEPHKKFKPLLPVKERLPRRTA